MDNITKILIGFLFIVIGAIIYTNLDLTCMNSCMGCSDSFLLLYLYLSVILIFVGMLLLVFGIIDE